MRYLFIILLINSSGFSELADGVYIEANKALIAENYYDAISKYESILNDGYESAELYYNLGNAYYRSEQLGKSIWAYSNALDIAPRNRDVAHNLSIANAQIVDRIEMPKSFVFITFYRLLKSIMTTYEWILVGSFLILIKSIHFSGMRFGLTRGKMYKMTSTVLISLIILAHIFAMDSYIDKQRKKSAVVISNNVNAYSGPFYGSSSILFQINEGIKVDISNQQKDWVEIILIDGKKGWIPSESIWFII